MRNGVAGPLIVAAAAACAQPGTPPGGEPDQEPPRVVSVRPAAFDTVTDLDMEVLIRFDERISERLEGVRNWEDAVVVSPATSPVRVDPSRRGLEISLARGWEPDRVYRVIVRPVFRDLFNNFRREPVELVFSTGAPIEDGALAGFVVDRLTAEAVVDARIEAVRRIDSTRYVALTDTAGFFAVRFLPGGSYDVRAWMDQNRDRIVDAFEVRDSVDLTFAAGDTAVVELALLRADTTGARLARAEPMDSTKIRLVFDDYFDAHSVDGRAAIHSLPDSAFLGTGALLPFARLDSLRNAEQAATDPSDTVPPSEGGGEGDREGLEARIGGPGGQTAAPRPSQELILYAPAVLEHGASYLIRVEGLTNIAGVRGGGGTAEVTMPAAPEPPPEEPPPSDTMDTGVPGGAADTAGAAGGWR